MGTAMMRTVIANISNKLKVKDNTILAVERTEVSLLFTLTAHIF